MLDKWKLYEALGYTTYHSEVRRFHDSTARIKVCCAPRRTTKSYSAAYDLIPDFVATKDFRIWIVGPSYELAEKEFRYMHEALVIKLGLKPTYARTNARSGKPILEFPGNRVIEAKSAENQTQLLGEAVDRVIYSEGSQLPRGIRERYVKPCLTTRKGHEIIPTTPDARGEWVNELFDIGQTENTFDIDSFTWDRTANPKYDDAEFEWAKRFYGEDSPVFREQYLGEWVFYGGLVWPNFSSKHIIEPFKIPSSWKVVRSIDFGYRDPFVCLWGAVGPNQEIYIFQEYYEREGRDLPDHASRIKAMSSGYNVMRTVGDPTEKQAIEDLCRYGIFCDSAINDRMAGRLRVAEYMTPTDDGPPPFGWQDFTGDKWPRVYFFNTCKETIRELKYYRWKEGRQVENETERTEGEDHSADCLRYLFMERPKPFSEKSRLNPHSVNAILEKLKRKRYAGAFIR